MIDSDRRLLLASRRALLVQRAAEQREQLAQAVVPLVQSWRWFERGLRLWQEVRRRPWLVIVPAGILLWWRPRAVLRTVAALPLLWRFGRSLQQAQRAWLR